MGLYRVSHVHDYEEAKDALEFVASLPENGRTEIRSVTGFGETPITEDELIAVVQEQEVAADNQPTE